MTDLGCNGNLVGSIPRIETSQHGGHTLLVYGKPFLMLAAELQNSSFSSPEYMSSVWPELKACHINVVFAPVTWEMIEPHEGTFDFTVLDKGISDARSNGLHLVLLWFGGFKNAKSTYVPRWVKINATRFPRAEIRDKRGFTQLTDALSIFSPNLVKSDAQAFRALMRHVCDIDKVHSTVLMVQVENEVGLLGDSRDQCCAARKQFESPVPRQLLDALHKERPNLHARMKKRLLPDNHLYPCDGSRSWAEVFGNGKYTDELFMAYHFALYVETVTTAGKQEYPIPHFTNVWQNYNDVDAERATPIVAGGGGEPGDYPSGGAVIDVLDIWQIFSPSLDFIAPDIYLNNYDAVCANYRHRGQPLLIPEQRRDEYGARRVWSAYGTHGALCASPFGIDTLSSADNPWPSHYRILAQAADHVSTAQRSPGTSFGFQFDELESPTSAPESLFVNLGGWNLTIERSFVFGKPGPGFGMVIQIAPSRFMLLGEGFQVRFHSAQEGAKHTGILSLIEQIQDQQTGQLVNGRMLNGDETRTGEVAIMPNTEIDYGNFPICITVPARTGIALCEVYALF